MSPRLAAALLLMLATIPARSEDAPTADAIVKALKPAALTRSFTAADPAKKALIERLRGKATRAITVEERQDVAAIAEKSPQIDLEVSFAYDSATILPEAVPVLVALGNALADDKLKTATLLVGGHTDGKGSASYNQALSERRAAAVERFLIEQLGIADDRLIAVGFGYEQPKNTADLLAPENRRVQVVNLAVE
jgi:outer membrane protein OmpA-like peptidoglycan-associated protein